MIKYDNALVAVIAALINDNQLREKHGEDTMGVLMKCGAFRTVNVVELARAVDAHTKK